MDKRVNDALSSWGRVVNQLNPERISTGTMVKTLRTAYENRVRAIRGAAGDRFRETIRPAIESLGGTLTKDGNIVGGAAAVSARNYLDYLRTHRRMLLENNEAVPAALTREIDDLAASNGNMTLGAMQSKLSTNTQELANTGLVLKDSEKARLKQDARASINNLLLDLEETSRRADVSSEAATALQNARDGFADDMVALNELRNSAVDNMLGKAGAPAGENFVNTFLSKTPSEQRELFRFLDDFAPDQSSILRGQAWAEIAAESITTVPRGNIRRTGVDFVNMSNKLAELPDTALAAIWDVTPTQANTMRDALDVLRSIGRGGSIDATSGLKSAINRAEAAAINLASRNEGFVARLVAGEMTPGAVERWLYTPEGARALLRVGNRNSTRGAVANGIQTLMSLELQSQQEAAELEAEMVQAQQQEQAQAQALQSIGGAQ
jgi:hypothetical protein